MNWVDFVVIAIVVFSAVVGLVRGFVKETFSLVTWVGAFVVAVIFSADIQKLLVHYVPGDQLRLVLAFAALFAATLLFGIVIGHLFTRAVEGSHLASIDRSLGLLFGIARGYVAVSALVVAASFTNVPRTPWWHHSQLLPLTRPLAVWITRHLPRSHLR